MDVSNFLSTSHDPEEILPPDSSDTPDQLHLDQDTEHILQL